MTHHDHHDGPQRHLQPRHWLISINENILAKEKKPRISKVVWEPTRSPMIVLCLIIIWKIKSVGGTGGWTRGNIHWLIGLTLGILAFSMVPPSRGQEVFFVCG